ncbi:hypothetical protein BB560_001514 [Smittium megazygosporum]|uniref:Uncharacterized protein n=1 Tax=Smittium megazygosporum TaxID=133381 RepID=A0A2T9ZHC9_9FUNG|nr:hypothetical protein BB560_001514 [Smittium megazygosporum]
MLSKEYVDSVCKAVETTYSISSTEEARTSANTTINALRYSKNCGLLGFELLSPEKQNSIQVKYLGLQLLEDQVKQFGSQDSMDPEFFLSNLKTVLVSFSNIPESQSSEDFIILKAANVCAATVLRLWPNGIWADFPVWIFSKVENRFLAFQIILSLFEEIIEFKKDPLVTLRKSEYNLGLTSALLPVSVLKELYPYGFRADESSANTSIKPIPGNENGWLYIFLETLASPNLSQKTQTTLLKIFQLCLKWLPFITIQKIPMTVSKILELISIPFSTGDSNMIKSTNHEIYILCLGCVLSLCSRPFSASSEKVDMAKLLVDEYRIQLFIYNIFTVLNSKAYESLGFEEAEFVELSQTAASVLSLVVENLVWGKKDNSFAPEQISDVINTLVYGARLNYVTISQICANGLVAMQNNKTLMLQKLQPQIFNDIKNLCIEKLKWCYYTVMIDPKSAKADDIEWEIEANGAYGGDFESFLDYREFVRTKYKSKISHLLQLMASLDPSAFAITVSSWVKQIVLSAQNSAVTQNDIADYELSLTTGFTLIDTAAKAIEEFLKSNEAGNTSEQTHENALLQTLDLFEIVVKLSPTKTETIKLQISTIENFAFLITKKPELILTSLGLLSKYLSSPPNIPVGERAEWNKVSYRAASIIEKLIKSDPVAFYPYYNDFVNLAVQKENVSETLTRIKVMLWEFPICFFTSELEIISIETGITESDILQKMNETVSNLSKSFSGMESMFSSPEYLIKNIGLSLLDNSSATEQDFAIIHNQKRFFGYMTQKLFAFVKFLRDSQNYFIFKKHARNLNPALQRLSPLVVYKKVWEEYGPSLMNTLLLFVRVLHALFNPELVGSVKWKSYLENRLNFNPQVDSKSKEFKDAEMIYVYLTHLLEYCHKIIGNLTFVQSVYFKIDNFAQIWATCLFGEVNHLPITVWKSLVSNVIQPCVLANSYACPETHVLNSRKIDDFFAGFIPHLNLFLIEKVKTLWSQLRNLSASDEYYGEFEAETRSFTRAYSELVSTIFVGIFFSITGINHEISTPVFSISSSSTGAELARIEDLIERKYVKKAIAVKSGLGTSNIFSVLSDSSATEDNNLMVGGKNEKEDRFKIRPNTDLLNYFMKYQKDYTNLLEVAKLLLQVEDTISVRKVISGIEVSLCQVAAITSFFTKLNLPNPSGGHVFDDPAKALMNLTISDFMNYFCELGGQHFETSKLKRINPELLYSTFVTSNQWVTSDFLSSLLLVLSKGYHSELKDIVIVSISKIIRGSLGQVKMVYSMENKDLMVFNGVEPSNLSPFLSNIKSTYINTMLMIMKEKYDYINDSEKFVQYVNSLITFEKETSTIKEPKFLFSSTKMLLEKLCSLAILEDSSLSLVHNSSVQVSKYKEQISKNQRIFGTDLYKGKKSVTSDLLNTEKDDGYGDIFDLGSIIP